MPKKIIDFEQKDYGVLLATDKIDASNGTLMGSNAEGMIPADTHNRTILIGLGGTGVRTINYVKRAIKEKLQPDWNRYIAFMGIDSDWTEIDAASCLERSEGVLSTQEGIEQRALDYARYPAAWRSFANPVKVAKLTNLSGAGAGRTRLMGKMKLHDRKSGQQGVDQQIVLSLAQLRGNVLAPMADGSSGHYEVYIIGSVSGGTCSGGFLSMPALIRKALNVDNLRVHAMLYLPDTLTNLDPQNKSELEANGYASLKELNYYQGMNMRVGYDETWSYNDPANSVLKIGSHQDFFSMPYLVGTASGAAQNSCKIAQETVAEFFISILGKASGTDGNHTFLVDSFLSNALQHTKDRDFNPGNAELEAEGMAHEFPKRFGAIGFASAAAPQTIVKAYAVGRACTTAGLQPVDAATKASMQAQGATLLPFRGEKEYMGAAEGSRAAQELVKPLEDLMKNYLRNDYNFQAHMQAERITWDDVYRGVYSNSGTDMQVNKYVENATSVAAMDKLKEDVQKAFNAYRANVKNFVAKEGPLAFVNLFEGSFILENGTAGTGVKALIMRARDDRDIRTNNPVSPKSAVACREDLTKAKEEVDRRNGLLDAIGGKRQEAANNWVACYNTWVNTRINEERRGQMLGAHRYIDTLFLQPAAILADELRAFGHIIARLAEAYQSHGDKLVEYDQFRNVADNETEVNIAAINQSAHNWLKQEADTIAKNIDGKKVRDALVDSFFEDPSKWLTIPDEAVRVTATGVSLVNDEVAIPARQMFDKCMQASINVDMDVTVENLFNQVQQRNVSYDVYAQQIVSDLAIKSKLLFNGKVDEKDKHVFIMYPQSLRQNNPDIVDAIESAAKNLDPNKNIGFYGTEYADSIMMYQLAAPFEMYRLYELAEWERQYENKMTENKNNGLHGNSPDYTTEDDKNGTVLYKEETSWYDYPAISYRKDPKQKDPATGKMCHEGQVRIEIDKLLNEARALGVLFSKKGDDGWQFYRVNCDKATEWTFDESLMRPDKETGLLPTGEKLAVAVAAQNDRELEEISRAVELKFGGLMEKSHSTEEWAWTYAKRVLYVHRPMLVEIRNTVEKFRKWNKAIDEHNKDILKKWKPAKMIRMLQAHVLYKDEEGYWNLEGSDIAVANLSPEGIRRLRRQFPEDAAVLDAGFTLFFLYNALLRHRDMKEDGMDDALKQAKDIIADYADEEVLDACFDYVAKTLKEESTLLEELGGNLDEPEKKPLSKFVKAMEEKEIEGEERLQEICKFYKMAKLWKKV